MIRGAQAITISAGPTFTPATNAPLAGLLQLTTDVDSRVSVQVSDGTNAWEKDFYDFSTTHAETLLGFRPNRTNHIVVTCYDLQHNASPTQEVTFITAPLPSDFPTKTVLTNQPSLMEPGYSMFVILRSGATTGAYIMFLDPSGQVVWYRPWTANDFDPHQMANGDIFMQQQNPSNNFLEMNMLGNTVRTWTAPAAYPVNSHEGNMTDHGTILYLSDVTGMATNFPNSTASNAPLVTARIDDNPIVEISATNSALLNTWSPLAFMDPQRISWLTYQFSTPYGVDNEHANCVIEDTNDDSLIVSMRDQNAVCKFSRDTGKLIWILGPPAGWGTNWQTNLLTAVGTPFNWNYGQHAPELTPQHTLLLYNDNNDAATPPTPIEQDVTNQSSAIEYSIDEATMEVSEAWNSNWQTNQDRLYTGALGKAERLPLTTNTLVTYGTVSYINGVHPSSHNANASMVRIKEYTHEAVPQVVFDLAFFDYTNVSPTYTGYTCYRSYRVPDLYTHPAMPVADLTIGLQDSSPSLTFSANSTHVYLVQSSTNLTDWATCGTAVQQGTPGNFNYTDNDDGQSTSRFYRVVTN
ncbi:MAG TPA: aryl-sulfate sulfotransferase [Verrucomicrobiae bacterium]|nr:aryl-sulfate sulfotransferase [Verrucomicrobiae bacterium]